MSTEITFALETLRCINEKDPSSDPYLWTAFVWIDDTTLTVADLTPLDSDDRVIIQYGLQSGQAAAIPASVGVLIRPFDTDLTQTQLILVTALWRKADTPSNVVDAGFRAFSNSLPTAIESQLFNLNSSDPATQQQAINTIKSKLKDAITSAITDALSDLQKAEIFAGLLTLDSFVDSSSQAFFNIANTAFTISLSNGSNGGRLLFYVDYKQDGTGDVHSPAALGQSGWNSFQFLFSGGNGILYAVNPQGQLLFYQDPSFSGTLDVNAPSVIGQGGWGQFKFLFSGGNGILYAVNPQGQLLFYRDTTQNGTGDVNTPSVIGQGGWGQFKFLFSGGNGILYAVNQQGQLLFYRDHNMDGTGDVNTPLVIGQGGWGDFAFLFSAGNGIIYAVDQQGRLLFYRDHNMNGTGDVNSPSVIGLGGWTDFQFVFSGGGGILYAAEKEMTPDHLYEIDGTLTLTMTTCDAEQAAVSSATLAVSDLNAQIQSLQTELQDAPPSQRLFLVHEIQALEEQLGPANSALTQAEQDLAACRARNSIARV